jgi:hypothetical protein
MMNSLMSTVVEVCDDVARKAERRYPGMNVAD